MSLIQLRTTLSIHAHFCVTSIYDAWHIGIASSSHFVALASVVVTLYSKMACQI